MTSHIVKPQADDQDAGRTWCGRGEAGDFKLTGADHALSCIITDAYVQPCRHCVAAIIKALTGEAKA